MRQLPGNTPAATSPSSLLAIARSSGGTSRSIAAISSTFVFLPEVRATSARVRATAAALDLTTAELVTVAENAARASFLPVQAKTALLSKIRSDGARA